MKVLSFKNPARSLKLAMIRRLIQFFREPSFSAISFQANLKCKTKLTFGYIWLFLGKYSQVYLNCSIQIGWKARLLFLQNELSDHHFVLCKLRDNTQNQAW